ncbi:MAG: YkvA family protein [Glaciecola sp.]
MSIQISLELSDNDLSHFRELMNEAMTKAKALPVESVISKAETLCDEMENANVPDFVKTRLVSLKTLITAIRDPEWQLPEDEKTEIVTSLAYFSEPHDLVPDNIPGLGYLDDAIMIELVIQDLSLDLQAYQKFCQFRSTEETRRGAEANVNRESWLAAERDNLRSGLRRKRRLFSR